MAILAWGGAWADPAQAEPQDQAAGNSAAAQALFEEGRQLMAGGNTEAACPKFEESQRLDPGVGTMFNLADCYEKDGRTASAWSLFLEVAAATKNAGQTEREALARRRADALRPNLSRLVIEVPASSSVHGLVVERDGVEVGKAQWGLAVPADPGVHVIRVSAPAKKAWETRIEIPPGPGVQKVSIPVLTDAPASETVGHEPGTGLVADRSAVGDELDTGHGKRGSWRPLAYGSLGVGVIGVAVGTAFGLRAISKNSDSNDRCQGDQCDAQGVELRDEARIAGNVSTAGFAVGGAGLAAGVLLLVLDRPSRAERREGRLECAPFATRESAGMRVGGTF